MRFISFKSQGFKSFADTVSFKMEDGLIGVVGPNGCGKSNVIDAIRWTLGESRHSTLRSTILTDVLFNGTEKRKSSDWCYVEIKFSNNNHEGGMWASYPELVIRREMSRDGGQSYTINNKSVRRRDVIDLFRGTGVTPKSYGVIEQGMIGHLAEANPEELRLFLEDAAGVSHYKDRRKESERRLKSSQENLSQIMLIINGEKKRIASLLRQAKTARRYQELSNEINQLHALLIFSRQKKIKKSLNNHQKNLHVSQQHFESLHSELEEIKTTITLKEDKIKELQSILKNIEQNYNQAKQITITLERDIENADKFQELTNKQLKEYQNELKDIKIQKTEVTQKKETFLFKSDQLKISLDKVQKSFQQHQDLLLEILNEKNKIEVKVKSIDEKINHLQQQHQVNDIHINMLEKQKVSHQSDYEQKKQKKLELLPIVSSEILIEEEKVEMLTKKIILHKKDLHKSTLLHQETSKRLNQLQTQWAAVDAELKTLNIVTNNQAKSNSGKRLTEVLKLEDGDWAKALDAALGSYLSAIVTKQLDDFLAQETKIEFSIIEIETSHLSDSLPLSINLPPLLSMLSIPEESKSFFNYWLYGVYAAQTQNEALEHRKHLKQHEIIVTMEGLVVGKHSLLLQRTEPYGYDWLQRSEKKNKEKENLTTSIRTQEEKKIEEKNKINEIEQVLSQIEKEREDLNHHITKFHIAESHRQERQQQQQQEQQQIEQDIIQIKKKLSEIDQNQEQLKIKNKHLQMEIKTAKEDKEKILLEKITHRLEDAQQQNQLINEKKRQLEIESSKIKQQQADCSVRQQELTQREKSTLERINHIEQEKEHNNKINLLESLNDSRTTLAVIHSKFKESEKNVEIAMIKKSELVTKEKTIEQQCQRQQADFNELRLQERELLTSLNRENDFIEELSIPMEELEKLFNEKESNSDLQSEIEICKKKQEKLGPVNFIADTELNECELKLVELEKQKEDIDTAIYDLHTAILRMDGETQILLQDLFKGINEKFLELFKHFFGGGEAALEITGESSSILEAGFEIKVRPPGKRKLPIRMLSGGEKAATAIAFIFSILKINPPPFCLLDEVDAPLDDRRALALVSLLKDISKTVQCIVVTHNKNTVSGLPYLVGITQQEAGASKIVSVNLRKALEMTETLS